MTLLKLAVVHTVAVVESMSATVVITTQQLQMQLVVLL